MNDLTWMVAFMLVLFAIGAGLITAVKLVVEALT